MNIDLTQIISHVKLINSALYSGNLAFFIGAGFSKMVHYDSPSWQNLTSELACKLDKRNKIFDSLKIAELYKIEFGEIELFNKIKSMFPNNFASVNNKVVRDLLSVRVNNIISLKFEFSC